MERRFDADFGGVRVHAGQEAASSATALNARAYTVGRDIVFGPGQFEPHTTTGQRLLAHELAHVVQQSGSSPARTGRLTLGRPDTPAEQAAHQASETVMQGGRPAGLSPSPTPGVIQRDPRSPELAEAGDEELMEEELPEPGYMTTSIIWFRFNSDRPREDDEISSAYHIAIAVRRIAQHAAVAGETQTITLHGYASREGAEARNLALSAMRALRVRDILVAAGIPSERIITIPHGPDSSYPGLQLNRRVEIELGPRVSELDLSEEEPHEVTGEVPRSGPRPIESTGNVLTPSHWALRRRERLPADEIRVWDEADAAALMWERATEGRSQTVLDYKDDWVRAHRAIIRAAAAESDIPDWFLAGVAWAEVGGDPTSIDYFAHSYRRDIGIGAKPPEETSFGAVSIQVRRAAEELGYDPSRLTRMQTSFIIDALADPQQNLFIVASHLDRLRDQDFPGKPGELLTDDDLAVIGARYNRGPDLSLERIRDNLSYGENIVNKKERLQRLLRD